MINYTSIKILKTFSKEDVKKFRDFLHSPFFNKSEKLISFYEALIFYYPDFDSRFLSEEKLLKKISPGLKFNKSTILNLFADLTSALKNYFLHINISQSPIESMDFIRNEFFRRNLLKEIESNLSETDSRISEVKNYDSSDFINKFNITNDKINLQILSKDKSSYTFFSNLGELHSERGKYITSFFLKEMLRGFGNLNIHNKTFSLNKDSNFVYKVLNELDFEKLINILIQESKDGSCTVILQLYLAFFQMFSKFKSEQHYQKYKKLYMKNIMYLNRDEIRFHNSQLLKYCMLKSSDEKYTEKYDRERFEIYLFMLENEFYKTEIVGYLQVDIYRTILLLSLKLKKYKWAFEFIKKYNTQLPPDKRDNMEHYSFAEYYFSRGQYEKAMKSFSRVNLNHFMLKLDIRNTMLMTYYELGLFENALTLIDSFIHFLRNDKTLEPCLKNSHKDFIKFVNMMIKYKTTGNKILKGKIEKHLKNNFAFKEWALEKLGESDSKYIKTG